MSCIHDLIWLTRFNGSLVPVPDESYGVISHVDELGEGSFELHWFGNSAEASAFKAGVDLIGANAVTAMQGQGGVSNCVLVCRLDRERIKAETLSEAISLVEHSNPTIRMASVTWKNETRDLVETGTSPYSSIRAAYIGEMSQEKVPFRFWYGRWTAHADYEAIKYAGTHELALVKDRQGKWLEKELAADSPVFTMGLTRGEKWRTEIDKAVRLYGGYLENKRVRIPLNGSLANLLSEVGPLFVEIERLEGLAAIQEKRRIFLERQDVRKTIKALADGGAVTLEDKNFVLSTATRKGKIKSDLVYDLIKFEVIEEDPKKNSYVLKEGILAQEKDPLDVEIEEGFNI